MRTQNLLWKKHRKEILDCIISLNEKRQIIKKVYRKSTYTGQYTHFSSNQPLHVKSSSIETLVRRAKFIFSDQASLNKEISYIKKKPIQLNGYPLKIFNKTIKKTFQSHNFEHKSKKLEPLEIFISYKKGVTEKLKRVASKYGITIVFTKRQT